MTICPRRPLARGGNLRSSSIISATLLTCEFSTLHSYGMIRSKLGAAVFIRAVSSVGVIWAGGLAMAFAANPTVYSSSRPQVVPTGCYEESAPIAGCAACNQTIPPPVSCPPSDCPPKVDEPLATEAVPVTPGGLQQRVKSGLHVCRITYFRCEQGTCVEDYKRSWSIQRLIPSGPPCQ